MYHAEALEICTEVFKLYHIRLQLFAKPYDHAEDFDLGLRKLFYQDYDYAHLLDRVQMLLSPGKIVYFQDEFGISYNIFSLKDGPEKTPYEFGVLGPWRRGELSEQSVQHIIENCGLKKGHAPILLAALNRIPENIDREAWIALCTRTVGKLISPDGNIRFYVPDAALLNLPGLPNDQAASDEVFHDYHSQSLHQGYIWERELLNCVKKGSYAQAEDLAHKYINFQLQYRRKRNISSTVIGIELNVLLRHAAQEAGVFSLRLEDTYMKYCFLISRSQGSIPYVMMTREYCDLVAQYANLNHSPIIRTCLDYIDFFYRNPITLHDLAALNSVTEQYLSSLFRKELGVTFVDYLNRTRVTHAKSLLQVTQLSIQEVAARCGFNDSSYFCRIFKKYNGLSPIQYRSSMLLE